jgi:GNAT superfamily N-acetyltransferase
MELLNSNEYFKLIDHLKQVKINNFFARSVIEKKIKGKVFVDNIKNPDTFYVIHPYGMSLLFGDSQNASFNNSFLGYALNKQKTRDKHEWMQAYPKDWDKVLAELFGIYLVKSTANIDHKEKEIIELCTRINFKFNREKFYSYRDHNLQPGLKMVRTNKKIFAEMKGTVIPYNFWDSANDFIENGVGFSLYYEEKLAATAYSAFIHDEKLELGIETIPEFRGRGYARLVCSALIDYCIENHYDPVWSCRLENTGSYRLAMKLGFEVTAEIPYYRLSK